VLGPVANADLVGLDLTIAIHDYVLPHLNVSTVPCDTLRARVKEGKLGFKTGSGFLDWTKESMAATREKLMTYLLEVAAKAKEVQ
jgi:3-hydroxybutyryl-CoA dehydrogenase